MTRMFRKCLAAWVFLATAVVWAAPAAHSTQSPEDEIPRRISFARGRNSAVVRGRWIRGTTAEWLVKARAGQTMTVKIKSTPKVDDRGKVIPGTENDATFDVVSPSGKAFGVSGSVWKERLPESGYYSILIVGGHGNTHYVLTVTVM